MKMRNYRYNKRKNVRRILINRFYLSGEGALYNRQNGNRSGMIFLSLIKKSDGKI